MPLKSDLINHPKLIEIVEFISDFVNLNSYIDDNDNEDDQSEEECSGKIFFINKFYNLEY